MMLISFVLFSSLAGVFYSEAESINEYSVRYDEKCAPLRGARTPCAVSFIPDVDLENPKVYYRLTNFYQNHRTFQKFSFA